MSSESVSDVRVGWVLKGAEMVWCLGGVFHRYTETSLPAAIMGRMAGRAAAAQAGENVQAEAFRARIDFGLQK